jgi:hypothetical protein
MLANDLDHRELLECILGDQIGAGAEHVGEGMKYGGGNLTKHRSRVPLAGEPLLASQGPRPRARRHPGHQQNEAWCPQTPRDSPVPDRVSAAQSDQKLARQRDC